MWILCVGSALIDMIFRDVNGFHVMEAEKSLVAKAFTTSAGGMALNTACQISGLDNGTQPPRWARIGLLAKFNSAGPNLIVDKISELSLEHVSTTGAQVTENGVCACTTRRRSANDPDVRRNFYVYIPANNSLAIDDVMRIREFAMSAGTDGWVHFANLAGEPSYYHTTIINLMEELRASHRVTFSANTVGHTDGLHDLRNQGQFVRSLDWLCVNVREAMTILEDTVEEGDEFDRKITLDDAEDAAERLTKHFRMPGGVAVTCGAKGSCARYRERAASDAIDVKDVKALPAIVDSVGCGDAWMAGFIDTLAGLPNGARRPSNNKELELCLKAANRMGVLALSKPGGSIPLCKRATLLASH